MTPYPYAPEESLPLNRYYIGLAATFHDPALAIVDPSGQPVFAEAAERYLQCKRAYNCPPDEMTRISRLIREHCNPEAGLVAAVSWSQAFLSRLNLMTATPTPFHTGSDPFEELTWPLPDPSLLLLSLRNSLAQAAVNLAASREIPNNVVVRRYDHHLTHAANAAYTSPFEECAVAVVDGYGEMSSTGFYAYRDGRLTPLPGEVSSPETLTTQSVSLGLFYSRVCALCRFDFVKGEEWKVMGLAAYGRHDPTVYSLLRPMIEVRGLTLTSGCSDDELLRRLRKLRAMQRPPDSSALEAADLAHTGQEVFEEVMTELLENLYATGVSENLALSGGCALNSTWNGRILQQTRFRSLHVPSAPGDDGNALGAALAARQEDCPDERPSGGSGTPYLGSIVLGKALDDMVRLGGLRATHAPEDVHERAARMLAQGKIIGWVQGPAEFGPRALGNRSILADPRPRDMKDRINTRVKFREEFRPFAPSILHEQGPDYFEDYQASPYMDRALRFRAEVVDTVPAVVHVDGTGRLQSVRREWSPRFYDLVAAFHRLTGVPVLLNTSFNVMGKPIIHSVEDALGVFFTTGLDALVIEDYLIEK